MDKEQKYRDWLINNQKEINTKIRNLNDHKMKNEINLIENQICPWCLNTLKEEACSYLTISSCSHCGYEHQWITANSTKD